MQLTEKSVKEIKLKKETGTRSGTNIQISAYTNGEVLVIDINNYLGNVSVEITDIDIYSSFFEFYCNGSNYFVHDISTLPEGEYILRITTDYSYTGDFIK